MDIKKMKPNKKEMKRAYREEGTRVKYSEDIAMLLRACLRAPLTQHRSHPQI